MSTLPEKEIGRDRRAEHRDQEREVGLIQLDMRNDSVFKDFAPLMGDQECDHDIRQQRRAQYFENERDTSKRANDQQAGYDRARQERPEPGGTCVEKLHARANGDQVGGDIERIRDDEDDEEYAKDHSTRPVKTLDRQFAQTRAGRKGRSIAYLLDGGHKRKGK